MFTWSTLRTLLAVMGKTAIHSLDSREEAIRGKRANVLFFIVCSKSNSKNIEIGLFDAQ